MTLPSGTQLGSYVVLSSLGSGGMGEVYKARDPRLNRLVAIKVLPESLRGDAATLARFQREACILAGFNHPHIVALHDVGLTDPTPFVVTELLEGETLAECLKRGPLPLPRALGFAHQIALGLVAAHARGIVHRDLKPSNVFLGKGDALKLLDFGLAKELRFELQEEASQGAQSPVGTQRGTLLGTVGYMSPEQVRGEPADARSDLFALGVLLLEMLTGRQAFTGHSAVEVLHAILSEDPLKDREVPMSVRPVLARLLAQDPEQRFQTAQDLVFCLQQAGLPAEPTRTEKAKRRPWLWAGLAVALVGLGAAAQAWLGRTPDVTYRQVTPGPATITGARFLDEQRAVFSQYDPASGEQVFVTDLSRTEAPRSLGISGAKVLSVSPRGEIAVLLRENPFQVAGSLAIIPAAGGAPRSHAEKIRWAAWGPEGTDLILCRTENTNVGPQVLEYQGRTLFKVGQHEAEFGNPTLSQDRRHLAIPYVEYKRGMEQQMLLIDVVKGNHKVMPIPQELLPQLNDDAYAWGPKGLWMLGTASGTGTSTTMHRLGSGTSWVPLPIPLPGVQRLHDISPQGRLLVSQGTESVATRWQDLRRQVTRTIPDRSGGLSMDGKYLMARPWEREGWMREVWTPEAALPVRLEGMMPLDLEAGTLLTVRPKGDGEEILLQPLGPGTPRPIPGRWRAISVNRLPTGHGVLLAAERVDTHQQGTWRVDLDTMALTLLHGERLKGPISPDGRWSFRVGPFGPKGQQARALVAVASGELHPKRVILPEGLRPVVWKQDGSGFWVAPLSQRYAPYPLTVDFWKLGDDKPRPSQVLPAPQVGPCVNQRVSLSADGQQLADSYVAIRPGHLFVVDGAKR